MTASTKNAAGVEIQLDHQGAKVDDHPVDAHTEPYPITSTKNRLRSSVRSMSITIPFKSGLQS